MTPLDAQQSEPVDAVRTWNIPSGGFEVQRLYQALSIRVEITRGKGFGRRPSAKNIIIKRNWICSPEIID
jgi:hypothetical protein